MCYSLSVTPSTLVFGGQVWIALNRSGPPADSFRWDLHHESRLTHCAVYPCRPIALPLNTPGLHRFTACRRRRQTPLARANCLVMDELASGLDTLLSRPGGASLDELLAHCATSGVPPEEVHRRLDIWLSSFLRVATRDRQADLVGLLLQLSRPRMLVAAARLGYARDGEVRPEDVVQAAGCRAFEQIDRFLSDDRNRRFGPWVTSITTHLGIDWYRHGKRERQHRRAPEGEPSTDPALQEREKDLRSLGIALMARAVKTLEEPERQLLSERLIDGASYEKLAAGRRMSLSTAHRQCQAAMKKLRREYERLLIEEIGEGG